MAQATLPVLVNREGGRAAKAGESLPDLLSDAFAKCGGAADIKLIAAADMPAAIAAAAGSHGRIAVAGGDGTMSCAAQALAGSDTELALLPLGTLNHLARDLAIPADLDAAAAVAVHGQSVKIDLGTVNGRYFINNASIGLYPLMVQHRDAVRHHRHWPKWLATVPAFWDALTHFPTSRLRVDLGAGEFPLNTRLLFIGNNRYSLSGAHIGSRPALDTGQLWALSVARRSRAALVMSALRTLLGHAGAVGDFHDLGDLDGLAIAAPESAIQIALDGEVMELPSPLKFGSRPGAMRVVVPDTPASEPRPNADQRSRA